ncbi:hypothetical protein ATKI12_6588 [Kitasatospora sp. Ki12]
MAETRALGGSRSDVVITEGPVLPPGPRDLAEQACGSPRGGTVVR